VDVIDLDALEWDQGFPSKGVGDHVAHLLGEMGEVANSAPAGTFGRAKRFPYQVGDVSLTPTFGFSFLEKHNKALLCCSEGNQG
jgi:hypothetical protein